MARVEADVHVASRIDPEAHLGHAEAPVRGVPPGAVRRSAGLLRETAASFHLAYGHPAFDEGHDPAATQEWLGVPLRFLASLDRRFFDGARAADRRPPDLVQRAAAGYVEWGRTLFESLRPDALLASLEDDLFSVGLVAAARRLDVPVLGWVAGRFPRRGSMFCWDFQELAVWNDTASTLEEIQAMYREDPLAGATVLEQTRGYWDLASLAQRGRDLAFARTYNRFRAAALRVHPAEAAIMPPLDLAQRARDHAAQMSRRRLVQRCSVAPQAGVGYVLLPLHYTQDAQMTFREPFLDQVALVRAVARSLPHGIELWVKPHPHYAGTDLGATAIRDIGAVEGVRIIEAERPPGPLVRKARAVVTINSTTGLEALLWGVPVVALGHDFYCRPEVCTVVPRLKLLPEAMARVLRGGSPPPEAGQDLVRVAHANTVWLSGPSYGRGFYGVDERSAAALASATDRLLEAGATPRSSSSIFS